MGVVLLAAVGFGVLDRLSRSPYVTRADTFREQPVQFSHEHHVGGLGIDCRYCHTSVEKSAFAGIPPTKTCMNCHSQIWTDEPDARAGARELPRRTSRWAGRASTTCPTSSTSTTASTSRRASAARPATGASTRCRSCTRQQLAADGVVPGLPPRPGEVRAAARASRSTMDYRAAAGRPARARGTAGEGVRHPDARRHCSTCHR